MTITRAICDDHSYNHAQWECFTYAHTFAQRGMNSVWEFCFLWDLLDNFEYLKLKLSKALLSSPRLSLSIENVRVNLANHCWWEFVKIKIEKK